MSSWLNSHLLSSLLLCSQLSQGCCLFFLSTLFCSLFNNISPNKFILALLSVCSKGFHTLSLSSTLAIFLLWGCGADLGRLCVRASSNITWRWGYIKNSVFLSGEDETTSKAKDKDIIQPGPQSTSERRYLKPMTPPFLFWHCWLLQWNWAAWSSIQRQAAVLETSGSLAMASHSCQGLAFAKFLRMTLVLSRTLQTI